MKKEYEEWMEEERDSSTSEKKTVRSGKRWAAALGGVLLAGVFAGGSVLGSLQYVTASAEEVGEIETEASLEAEEDEVSLDYDGNFETTYIQDAGKADSVLPDVSDVVETCMKSMVSITNTVEVTTSSGYNSSPFGGFEEFFFGNGRYNYSEPQEQSKEAEAYGSGIIIDENGEELLILTNNHVAVVDETGNAYFYTYKMSTKSLSVTFSDGTTADATLKGSDVDADLAVIAVKLSSLSDETKDEIRIAKVGSDEEIKLGQGVIAIGNALGRGQSVTIGYISAFNREVTTEDGITRNMMQIDAAINRGNSGGGLFNSAGELIGINSAKNGSEGVEGVGFAIPIASSAGIISDLKSQDGMTALSRNERGYLGISGATVDETRVNNYGYPAGAVIFSVTPGSPAEAAGLQINDIITAVNDVDVSSFDELKEQLSYYAVGETVSITLQRVDGNEWKESTIDVTLGSMDMLMQ